MYPAGLAEPSARTVRLRSGERVRVVECGPASGMPVVCIPGWACSVYLYRKNLPVLGAAGYRAIAVDLRGQGLSDKPSAPEHYTTDAMVAHLGDVLDALDIECAALVGLSMGGALALDCAIRYPHRVRAVALLNPTSLSGVPWLAALRLLTPVWVVPMLPVLVRRWMVAAALRLVYGSRARPTAVDADEYWAPAALPGFARAMRHLLHQLSWGPTDERLLAGLRLPVLLVVGTEDRLVRERTVARRVRTIVGARIHVVRGAGHAVSEEAAAETNAALAAFLAPLARA